MRKITSLILSLVFLLACNKDEEPVTSDLHYDGPNQTAPFIEAGTHETAAKFTIVQTGPLAGRNLTEVQYYLVNLPATCSLRVYAQGDASTPGTLLYSSDLSGEMTPNSWNRHVLSTPVTITGEDLWIAIRVEHQNRTNTIGCDPGPANRNGDWILSSSDNEWKTFRERTNLQVNINWNIRGVVSN